MPKTVLHRGIYRCARRGPRLQRVPPDGGAPRPAHGRTLRVQRQHVVQFLRQPDDGAIRPSRAGDVNLSRDGTALRVEPPHS